MILVDADGLNPDFRSAMASYILLGVVVNMLAV
jgi:hypothetical protein